MAKNGKKKSSTSGNKNRVAVELKDVKFEGPAVDIKANMPADTSAADTATISSPQSSSNPRKMGNLAATKLEKILSELEQGYLSGVTLNPETCTGAATSGASDSVGYLRKKMAALGFQAGIQLSGAGAFRDARRLLDGFPGDDEYELTFEEIETEDEDEEDEAEEDEEDENYNVKVNMNGIRKVNLSETDEDEFNSEEEEDFDLLNNEEDILLERLDPLRVLNKSARAKNAAASTSLNYPLIDPLKLQVIQSAESELTTVHDLFESTSISANQKLPLLKRKYMELMQQDIRHRLEALRVRDYLDTLHLERQVVERELEKAINLRASMEQLCEQLQAENTKIRAEKAGITAKIYGDLELKALEEELNSESSKNNSKKKSGKKQQQQQQSNNKKLSPSGSINFTNTNALPESLKSVSFEVPDANKLLEGAQGDLRSRFQLLIDLYNQREAHFVSVLRAKDTEIHLLQSHFFSHQGQIQKLTQTNRELTNRVSDLSSSESDLRAQLSVYVDKFKQVEDTLSKSNDLFATFRHEMEQMTTKLSKLEKENQNLQSKCATLSRNIIEMADERSKQASALDMLKTQKAKLENLCRSMQAERNAAIRSNNNANSSGNNGDTGNTASST